MMAISEAVHAAGAYLLRRPISTHRGRFAPVTGRSMTSTSQDSKQHGGAAGSGTVVVPSPGSVWPLPGRDMPTAAKDGREERRPTPSAGSADGRLPRPAGMFTGHWPISKHGAEAAVAEDRCSMPIMCCAASRSADAPFRQRPCMHEAIFYAKGSPGVARLGQSEIARVFTMTRISRGRAREMMSEPTETTSRARRQSSPRPVHRNAAKDATRAQCGADHAPRRRIDERWRQGGQSDWRKPAPDAG